MTEYVQGRDAHYWYQAYVAELRTSQDYGERARAAEAQVRRQATTIGGMRAENQRLQAALDAQNAASDAPVDNDGTSALEERVNKLENIVEAHDVWLTGLDFQVDQAEAGIDELKKSEPVPNKIDVVNVITKGAAMLDMADALNRSFNKRAGRKM